MIFISSSLNTTQSCSLMRNRKLIHIMDKFCWQYFILSAWCLWSFPLVWILHQAAEEVRIRITKRNICRTPPPSLLPPQAVPYCTSKYCHWRDFCVLPFGTEIEMGTSFLKTLKKHLYFPLFENNYQFLEGKKYITILHVLVGKQRKKKQLML